ncbi:MAG: chorismate mutase [Candidatus Nanopelagicales bacterium]|nr:chorismate mutase [Candidatus Nanopelagicales bacterium]
MAVRGIRGATRLSADDPAEMSEAVIDLLSAIIERNDLRHDDLVSILFTSTPDLVSAFPATSAREIGLADVPLLCAQEIDVAGALPRVIRILVHAETELPRARISHIYQRGAESLREDLAH